MLQSVWSKRVGHNYLATEQQQLTADWHFFLNTIEIKWVHWWCSQILEQCKKLLWKSANVKVSCSVTSDSCDHMHCSLPGSSVHGMLQARIMEWVAIPFSKGSCQPRDQAWVSCIAGRFFTVCATKEAKKKIAIKVSKFYLVRDC